MQLPTSEPRAPSTPPPVSVRRLNLAQRVLRIVSWISLATILAATSALWFISERTWWGTVLTFLPRHAFLAAPGLLLVVSLFVYRRMILVNLAGILLAAFPLMGAPSPVGTLGAGRRRSARRQLQRAAVRA